MWRWREADGDEMPFCSSIYVSYADGAKWVAPFTLLLIGVHFSFLFLSCVYHNPVINFTEQGGLWMSTRSTSLNHRFYSFSWMRFIPHAWSVIVSFAIVVLDMVEGYSRSFPIFQMYPGKLIRGLSHSFRVSEKGSGWQSGCEGFHYRCIGRHRSTSELADEDE